ncbi:hypothetical protein PIB30_009241 [Stylosanthes scabra]|uniref:Uncharacterized protein n=1 Tax=Stylosanthes scabra TaxID=79078 RepID=A0ABU6Q5B9_9FABA|nr:hypothetical protein [Stylosanthes scabra]
MGVLDTRPRLLIRFNPSCPLRRWMSINRVFSILRTSASPSSPPHPPHAHHHHPEPNLIVPPSFTLNLTFPLRVHDSCRRLSFAPPSRTRVQAPTSNLCIADFAPSALPPSVKNGDTIFVDQYLFTRSETTSVWLELIAPSTLIKFLSFFVMDNSNTKSKEDVNDTHDLSFEYECNSDESDNMAAADVNMSEANAMNIDGEEKLITFMLDMQGVMDLFLKKTSGL